MNEKINITFEISEKNGFIGTIDHSDPSTLMERKLYSCHTMLMELKNFEKNIKDEEKKESIRNSIEVLNEINEILSLVIWEKYNAINDLLSDL